MEKSLGGLLWLSFTRIQGVLVSVVGIVTGILLWQMSPTATVRLMFVVPAAIVVTMIIAVLAGAVHEVWSNRRPAIPRVLYATQPKGETESQLICLLEPSDWFSYGLGVAFYYVNDDGFELLVGIGRVINVQDDGRIQVVVTRTIGGNDGVVAEIASGNKGKLERVRVKPSIPHDAQFDGLPEKVHSKFVEKDHASK